MLDFEIKHGLSTDLFLVDEEGYPNYEELNPAVDLKEGYWYLCIDTAELFLCTTETDELTLKRINSSNVANRPSFAPDAGNDEAPRYIIDTYLDEEGKLHLIFSDNTEDTIGPIIGEAGEPGVDGKTPYIKEGNWWIDEEDTGIRAEGTPGAPGADGKDGITPAFKIENGELFASYDNSSSWGSLGNVQGADGEKGAAFTFEDFTEEQLESLKVKGDPGQDGKNGLTTAVTVGETLYEQVEGVINLPLFANEVPFTSSTTTTVSVGGIEAGFDLNGTW